VRRVGEHFRRRLTEVVGADEPASRLAAAWALGLAIAFSPFLGLQTILALLASVIFRLNKIDTLLGTLVMNPWTLAVYLPAATVLGQALTGISVPRLEADPATLFTLAALRSQGAWLRPLLLCWLVGASVIAALVGIGSYLLIRRAVAAHRRHAALPRPD
jgi:uncharacterized protein